jgi:xanthine dehydrogenase YagR molybdenum-binding subunit
MKYTLTAGLRAKPQALEVDVADGDLRPWDLDSKLTVVMGREPRQEAVDKVTGRAKYTFDLKLPGMLWAKMVRATVPAAHIRGIDTARAQALPSVRALWTTESKTVRFAGQDIAAVAADSPEAAEDAARLITVDYEEKPFVTDLRRAIDATAPWVYEPDQMPPASPEGTNVRGNVVGPVKPRGGGVRGDVQAGLRAAHTRIDQTYYVPVHTHAPLETHGVIAHWEGDQLTVYASTQGVFAVRNGLADALGIDRQNVRVLVEHMGGGFGSKLGPSATGSAFAVVACRLAKQAGRPVKLMLDRHEEHLCTGNAPSALMSVRLGAREDGTLTAVEYVSYGSAGIADGAGTSGPANALYTDCPNFKAEDYSVFTNAGPAAPLRAPGHPQGAFALESAMDELAHALNLDPLELRRRNESSPVRREQYEIGARAIGWERRNRVPGAAPGPRKRGLGMANGNWYVIARDTGIGAEVRVHRDGGVELFTGAQDIGTGFRTAMAMVVAEELGLRPAAIKVRLGDSRWPEGPGSGGSNTTNTVAPAVRLAAHQAGQKLCAAAAAALRVSPTELALGAGRVYVARTPTRGLTFKQAALKMKEEQLVARVERPRQFETYRRDLAGTQFCEVEVDVETGVVRVLKLVGVHDCGLPINTLTTESQVLGALIQGASWALFEERVLDPNLGSMLNPNLESYKILMPQDMFEAVAILTPVANGGNNTSTAGIGEPPIVPTLAAIANAVFNATGARLRDLPLTPDKVLTALAEARRRI